MNEYAIIYRWDSIIGGWMDEGIEFDSETQAQRAAKIILENGDEDTRLKVVFRRETEYANDNN